MVMKSWSWGNYPHAEHQVIPFNWLKKNLPDAGRNITMLPYGCGRSYGDVPVNHGGAIITTNQLNRFIAFDVETGVLRCEAGVTLQDVLRLAVPHGWFLPVTPGTQFVTLGGAIANDVHGKNHHSAGTFGRHVRGFELLRSDRDACWCSDKENEPLFKASIGGLGLTGLIVVVELQLLKVAGPYMDVDNIVFDHLDAGLELFKQYDEKTSYTVAWIDCLAKGSKLGRGLFTAAEHSQLQQARKTQKQTLSVPFNFPGFSLNKWTVKAFNECYFQKGKMSEGRQTVDYVPFFYPLDGLLNWNRIYGSQGFFQYQCVVPINENLNIYEASEIIRTLLTRIADSGNASFLAVLKTFGDVPSPGLLSFPVPGITLALDFPNKGQATLRLLNQLDDIVSECGGRVYPAKDARMSAAAFQQYFPQWQTFSNFIDPEFSSSFWRRVTEECV